MFAALYRPLLVTALIGTAGPMFAEPLTLAPVTLTEWKAVYGRIEARNRIPARARLGGTLTELAVAEGDQVTAGQVLGKIVDEKLAFQLSALDFADLYHFLFGSFPLVSSGFSSWEAPVHHFSFILFFLFHLLRLIGHAPIR